jgi:K+-transporting ATPase KdpF subunit
MSRNRQRQPSSKWPGLTFLATVPARGVALVVPPEFAEERTLSETNGVRDGRAGVHRADSGGFRPARPGSEVGRTPVNFDNAVGLALSAILALFLVAALLFPERF